MEQWKDIKGCPGYQVSNFGRVKSLKREIRDKNGVKRRYKEKILKPDVTPGGYAIVKIAGINRLIHRLVAEAFHPNPKKKPYVRHKNTVYTHNHEGNLEWCTPSESKIEIYKLKKSLNGKTC